MRSLRKTLVMGLIVAMVCGLAGTAFASTVAGKAFTDITGHAYAQEITMMRALGIMMGDAGTTVVRPDAPISRAEFAVVVVRMLGRESLATALSTYQPAFADDVPTWAWGHVNVAVSMGIIKGYGDGTFGASGNVTHAEALAMLVRATGHEPGIIGTWPVNYMIAGYDLGIIGKVDSFANLPATRGEIGHFAYNALDIKRGTGTGVLYNPEGAKKILNDTTTPPALRQWTGLAGVFSATAKTLVVGGTALNLADSVYLWTYGAFGELFNTQVRAVANTAGKVVYIEPYVAVNVVKGLFKSLQAPHTDGKYYIVLKDDSKVEYTGTGTITQVSRNRATAVNLEAGILAANDELTITLAAGKAAFVDAYRVNVKDKILTSVTAATSTALAKLNIDGVGAVDVAATAVITLNGAAAVVGDLKADDVLYVATVDANTANAAFTVEAIRNVLQGAFQSWRLTYTDADNFWRYITLKKADGTVVEVKWFEQETSATIPTAPTAGSVILYALNKDNNARKVLSATLTTNLVKVTGVGTIAGSAKMSVTFDVRGSSVTYIAYAGFSPAEIHQLGEITINAATGEVDGYTRKVSSSAVAGLTRARIHSVDAAANVVTVQLYDATASGGFAHTYYITHADFVAYAEGTSTAIGAFIPTASLAKGEFVYIWALSDLRVMAIFKKATQVIW